MRIAVVADGTLYYLHADHLGSTVMTTEGHTVITQEYNAYGSKRGGGTLPTGHAFTGQKRDGTGLLYYNARYYDPLLGQFISPDTIIPDTGLAIDYNRFAYSRGNPLKYNDPTGHYVETLWDVANISIGAASLGYNVSNGYWGAAAVDAGGLIIDVAATAIPFVPAGASTAIKATRGANAAINTVQSFSKVDDVVDGARTLYHGTTAAAAQNIVESSIDLTRGRPNLDFNSAGEIGFYVTDQLDQARKWATRTAKRYGDEPAIVAFDIAQESLSGLSTRAFNVADSTWSKFVTSGRKGTLSHSYDVVEGPMLANPQVAVSGRAPAESIGHQLAIFTNSAVEIFDRGMRGIIE